MEDYSTAALVKRYFPPYLLGELWEICIDYLTYKIMDAGDGIRQLRREINGVKHGAIYHYLRNGKLAYKYHSYLGAPSGVIEFKKGELQVHEEYYKGYIKYHSSIYRSGKILCELKVSGIDEDINQEIGQPSKLTIEFTEYSDDDLPSIIYTVKNGIGFCRITKYKQNMYSLYNFKAIKSDQKTALSKLDTFNTFKCRIPIRESMHGISEHVRIRIHEKFVFDNDDRAEYKQRPPLHGMIVFENDKQYAITSLDELPSVNVYEMYTYYRGIKSGLFITKTLGGITRGRYYKNKLDGLQETFNNGSLSHSHNYCRGKQHGPQFEFYFGGALYIVENYYKGKQHGQQITFYPDGLIRFITNYWHGTLHGIHATFHTNGQVQSDTYYCNGKSGITRKYYPSGTISSIDSETMHVEFYGETKSVESQCRNGLRHGKTTTWYHMGGIESIHNYENNELHGEFVEYYRDGSVYRRGTYYNGYISSYHKSGFHYENGMLDIDEGELGSLVIKKKLPKGTLLIV